MQQPPRSRLRRVDSNSLLPLFLVQHRGRVRSCASLLLFAFFLLLRSRQLRHDLT